jgi:predicted Zn finger-like uncharacterized protein
MAIAFSCQHCGKQYRVNDDLAGKKIKCSKCGQAAKVPGKKIRAADSGDPSKMFGFEATARQAREEGFEQAFPEGRPTGSGFTVFRFLGVPILLALILAPIVGVLGLAYDVPAATKVAAKLHIPPGLVKHWVLPTPGVADDARYFPNNCKAVALVNVQNIVNSEAYQSAEKEADKEGGAVAEWKKLGENLSFEDIASITAGASGDEGRPTIVVLRFNKPVTADEIQAAPRVLMAVQVISALVDGREPSDLVKPEDLKFEQDSAGGKPNDWGKMSYTTYESDALSFCVISDRAFAFGPRATLREILERKDHPKLSHLIQDGLFKAGASDASFVLVAERAAIPENLAAHIPPDYSKKVDALAASLHLNSEVVLQSTVFCKTDNNAEALGKEADQTLNAINTVIAGMEGAPKDPLKPETTVSGKRVTVSITTDVEKILQGKMIASRILGKND